MPSDESAVYDGYYHCSAECWSVYSEVLGFEFSNAVVFGQVHQTTVDAYAVQHAGGRHKAKSVTVHLVGLHLALDRKIPQRRIPGHLQDLCRGRVAWPDWTPPAHTGPMTICDVALAPTAEEHIARVTAWSRFVWQSWSDQHAAVMNLCSKLV